MAISINPGIASAINAKTQISTDVALKEQPTTGLPKFGLGNGKADPQKPSELNFSTALKSFVNDWEVSQRTLNNRIKGLAPENRDLINVQVSVNRLNVYTQVMTQVGETVNSSLKRLQQMGS